MDTVFRQIVARSTPNRGGKRKGEEGQRPKRERAGFSSGPNLRTKSFLRDAASQTYAFTTHTNRILHLTNADRVTQALSPASHQYWGQCSNCRRAPCGGTSYTSSHNC